MTCRLCATDFVLRADHAGYANVCMACSEGDVERVMAKVSWAGKHDVRIEVTSDTAAARRFNNAQKRFGASVTKSLVAGREPSAGREARKDGSGAELGALYHSRLGEKRSVKR